MKNVEHWDDDAGKHFTIPSLSITEEETSTLFVEKNRDVIMRSMYKSLLEMEEFGYAQVPLFSVNDDVVFYLEAEESETGLERCIEYFTETEEYEKCIKLNQIKKQKNEKTK